MGKEELKMKALVTGATSGIGKSMARKLRMKGWEAYPYRQK